jgi:outer membrane lipoprotein SlyB
MTKKVVIYTPDEKAAETLGAAAVGAAIGGWLAGPLGAVIGGLLGAAAADD